MQGKLFHRCTHFLYCSVLSLGGNVNTRRMLQPNIGSIFHIKKTMKYSGHRKLLFELSKLSNLMLLTSSDTKRTLMHLFLFTNSAQRELVSICTQNTTAINFPCITPFKIPIIHWLFEPPLLYFIHCVWNEASDTVLYYLGRIYRKWWKFEIFFLSCKENVCVKWNGVFA